MNLQTPTLIYYIFAFPSVAIANPFKLPAVPPKLSPFQTSILQLNMGDRASLTCSVVKGDLPLSISWRKDNRPIDPTQHMSVKQVDQYNSILVIEILGSDHTGNYSCVVRNSAAEVENSQALLVNGKEMKPPQRALIVAL